MLDSERLKCPNHLNFHKPSAISCKIMPIHFIWHTLVSCVTTSLVTRKPCPCLVEKCIAQGYGFVKSCFRSRSQIRVSNFYSTFGKKSTLSRANPTATRLHLGGRPLTPSPTQVGDLFPYVQVSLLKFNIIILISYCHCSQNYNREDFLTLFALKF